MKKWKSGLILAVAVLTGASACSTSPSAPSVSFTAPVASQPSTGTTFKFKGQPVSLVVNNATRSGAADVTYSVEVATDSGFANKVFTKEGIAEASGATTNVTLTSLNGGATYYWRWKAIVDGVVGSPSTTQSFVVQQQVVLNSPSIVEPASGATASVARPTFTINNATRTGPAGPVTYEFQVSTSSTFSPLTASATVAEQGTRTSWTPNADLPETNLFWRVRAKDDENTEVSGFTGGTSFTLRLFNINDLTWINNPNISKWAETSKITSIDFSTGYILVDFDKRDGPGRWPDVAFGGGSNDGLQYTLGMCFNLGGKWFCSAAIQFWHGRDLHQSGPMVNVQYDWFYDALWGPMNGHQPAIGEPVAIFAVNGNVRDSLNWSIEQRTDFVVTPFGTSYTKK